MLCFYHSKIFSKRKNLSRQIALKACLCIFAPSGGVQLGLELEHPKASLMSRTSAGMAQLASSWPRWLCHSLLLVLTGPTHMSLVLHMALLSLLWCQPDFFTCVWVPLWTKAEPIRPKLRNPRTSLLTHSADRASHRPTQVQMVGRKPPLIEGSGSRCIEGLEELLVAIIAVYYQKEPQV